MMLSERETSHVKIITLFEARFSLKRISNKLSIPYSTVKKVVTRYRERGSLSRKIGSGRPRVLKEEDIDFILTKIDKNPKLTTNKLASELQEKMNLSVSKDTIRRVLKNVNLKSCVAAVKALLKKEHLIKRYELAKDWLMRPFKYFLNLIFS